MNFDYDELTRHCQRRFGDLRKKEYLPFELVELLERVAFVQMDAMRDAVVALPDDAELAGVEENLQGKPLLARESFYWDKSQANKLYDSLADLVLKQSGPMAEAAGILAEAEKSGELSRDEAFKSFVVGSEELFETWGKRTPEAPRSLVFLIQGAITPSLAALAGQLAEKLPKDRSRSHGNCPVCGSLPLITVLKNKEGVRMATCSFCRTEYRVRRLACPFCDEDDHKKLKFYDVKEEPGFRIDTCDTCKMYIKGVDFRALDKVSVPTLDDLESLPLDFLAMEKGYARPTMSAWGF